MEAAAASTESEPAWLERHPAPAAGRGAGYRGQRSGADLSVQPPRRAARIQERDCRASARRALNNLLETYPAFVALALGLIVTGKTGGLGATGAWIWLIARVVYVIIYAAGHSGREDTCLAGLDHRPCADADPADGLTVRRWPGRFSLPADRAASAPQCRAWPARPATVSPSTTRRTRWPRARWSTRSYRRGGEAFAVQADVGNEADIIAMFAMVDRRFGPLDAWSTMPASSIASRASTR